MPICNKCEQAFPNHVIIEGKQRNLCNRRYCLDCSPWGQHNTRKICDPDLPVRSCKDCGKDFEYSRIKGSRKEICNSCITQRSQRKRKLKAIEFFGGKCTRCGYDRCPHALEFHHVEEKTQRPNYAIMSWSWERAKAELEKCILVCANCHRELHWEAHQALVV